MLLKVMHLLHIYAFGETFLAAAKQLSLFAEIFLKVAEQF